MICSSMCQMMKAKKMKNKNEFSALKLFISMLIAWAIVFVGAWASKGFSADFFVMPRFTIVLVVSVAGAIVIGPAIYGFLYIGRRHDK
ncbi:Predicted protein [Lactobacillus helveticus H10]|nr:Predicted protein [Lactobacillus helveticus H10]